MSTLSVPALESTAIVLADSALMALPQKDYELLPEGATVGASTVLTQRLPRIKPKGAASDDELSAFSPTEVAAWYRRLAESVRRSRPDSLAAAMLLHWLDGKGAPFTFAASKVENLPQVRDMLQVTREVLLTERMATLRGGVEKWAGVLPRIQRLAGYPGWDGKSPIDMNYTGPSVSVPLSVQAKAALGLADEDELDILMSLHSFGLETKVVVSVSPKANLQFDVKFDSWRTHAFDRYDWDPTKHLTMPNPDFRNPRGLVDPIAADREQLRVYHSNAGRVELAGLASPYDATSPEWTPSDPAIVEVARVDGRRKL